MRPALRRCLSRLLGCACALLLAHSIAAGTPGDAFAGAGASTGEARAHAAIVDSTWVDDDREPIQKPPDWEPNYYKRQFHQGVVEPLTHAFDIPDKLLWLAKPFGAHSDREAVNVNAFDEAPNSSWFTNRNHLRAVPVSQLRQGPDSVFLPAKPWILKHAKQGGRSPGFQIKSADGKKWLVKLDPRGYPQLSSGADMVARTLLHAAGYNVPHNTPVRFQRRDITIDPELLQGAKGEVFTDVDLDSLLAGGARFADGSYSGFASLFIAGHVLGAPSMDRPRPGDTNDWYSHIHRRELRGLFVLCSWINNPDTKEQQFLDTFVETKDSLGHVEHYILDAGASFGAGAVGPKQPREGYENTLDFGWTTRRLVTLGFVEEPWRRANQQTGIPSVGNFESEVYTPEDFQPLVEQSAFREMTDRDGYWGAKIVASFSDAQIAAAVESAGYEDPRARDFLVRNLIVRRDKIARHWFGRVAPLDFFSVNGSTLDFHDLAVEIGLEGARAYAVRVERVGGSGGGDERVHLDAPELSLTTLGRDASRLSLEISVAGSGARPTHVELTRKDARWILTRVRHG